MLNVRCSLNMCFIRCNAKTTSRAGHWRLVMVVGPWHEDGAKMFKQVSPTNHSDHSKLCCSGCLQSKIHRLVQVMMQLGILRKIDSHSSVRRQPHNSIILVMPKRKAPAVDRNAKRPKGDVRISPWWNDEVQFHSDAMRNDNAFDTSGATPVDIKTRIRATTTSMRKTKEQGLVRLFRLRILPSDNQKFLFHRWFGIHRMAFNKTTDLLNAGDKRKWTDLRTEVLHSLDSGVLSDNRLSPCDLRSSAVHAAASSYKASRESLKKKQKDPTLYPMRHLTKKDATQQFKITCNGGRPSCKIFHDSISFWPRKGISKIKVKRILDLHKLASHYPSMGVTREAILHYERPNVYYLLIPVLKPLLETQPVGLVIATDPGVRTFHTTYDSQGRYNKELDAAPEPSANLAPSISGITTIVRRCHEVSKLQSKIDKHIASREQTVANGDKPKRWVNTIQKLNRRLGHLRIKIANYKRDMHWKLASSWCDKYTDMIVPVFNSSQMVGKFVRKISKKSVRELLHWGHYNFRQRLISKAAEKGVRVHEVDEKYTTMTCGKCGHMRSIGSAKTYVCYNKACNHVADRDENAAFNIFLKHIGQVLVFNTRNC